MIPRGKLYHSHVLEGCWKRSTSERLYRLWQCKLDRKSQPCCPSYPFDSMHLRQIDLAVMRAVHGSCLQELGCWSQCLLGQAAPYSHGDQTLTRQLTRTHTCFLSGLSRCESNPDPASPQLWLGRQLAWPAFERTNMYTCKNRAPAQDVQADSFRVHTKASSIHKASCAKRFQRIQYIETAFDMALDQASRTNRT